MEQRTSESTLSPLKRAFQAIEQMQMQLDSIKFKQHEPIAIIGMGCRYPGGVDTPERFWQKLLDGFDAIIDLPDDRAADLRWQSTAALPTGFGGVAKATAELYLRRGGF